MYRTCLAAMLCAVSAGAASAQVFVIGGGFAKDCYDYAKARDDSFRPADETCTRALHEEALSQSNRSATYVNRGVIRMRHGDYESAIDDYTRAIGLTPELGAAYLNEGAAHIYRRDYEAALRPLNKAIELQSNDLYAAYYNRAIARENTGDVVGAYYDFRKALELNPGWDLAEQQLTRFTVEQQ